MPALNIDKRAQYARAMDEAAAALMLAAEQLLTDPTLQRDAAYRVDLALGEPVKRWRAAVAAYRGAGGLRLDLGGIGEREPAPLPPVGDFG